MFDENGELSREEVGIIVSEALPETQESLGLLAHLSSYFSSRACSVVATDREPKNFLFPEIPIAKTPGAELPFEANHFDIVVYNHVIEHVGTRLEQRASLDEIRRVLRPNGLLYLAVPNRWTLVEPHYRVPALSWLPQRLADAWVRKLGRGTWYDCNPFGRAELLRFVADAGFEVEDVTAEAFFDVLRIEK